MVAISIIIPTLNEASRITATLAALRQQAGPYEVIVADGGSSDATVALAEGAGARLVCAPLGRGPQLNAGAAAAQGAILLFLHADTELPPNGLALVAETFADPKVQIAKFRLGFDQADWPLAIAARLMWLDSTWSNFGDQVMVIRRPFFERLGGFPAWPLFEDVALFEHARYQQPVYTLPATVRTSARRFQQRGSLRQLAHDTVLLSRFLLGADPHQLAEEYRDQRE